ncbi:uncharacterized protein LOC123534482 [Mercenaria mercenaria]|uniref:uncharacterized protein LOC123534482 n=1 Tax=Mercenaria mercenaria TaxID=6596 RepID=UPI00234F5E89|nr:uncharacterized protein LOC123534482 [Mercenaria mercenaria]
MYNGNVLLSISNAVRNFHLVVKHLKMEILALILAVTFAWAQAADSDEPPILNISLADGSNKLFVEEKTVFNVTVQFPGTFYDDVIIDILPTIDLPDVVITKVKTVKVGSNLHFTGSIEPVMDYGRPELQVPGKALSCQFHLGKVLRSRKIEKMAHGRFNVLKATLNGDGTPKATSEDDTILIQYEALIPEERSEGFGEIGHDHMYAVRVETAKETYFLHKHVTVAARSMPMLFRTLEKFPARRGNMVEEMFIFKARPQRKLLKNTMTA